MNNKIFTSNHILYSLPVHEAIIKISEAGYDGVEIWADSFFTQEHEGTTSVELIQDALKKTGLLVSIHAPIKKKEGKWNISSKDEQLRKQSVEMYFKTIDVAKQFGAKIINIHPWFTDKDDYDDEYYQLNLRSLWSICDAAEKKGIKISMEIMEERPNEFIKTPEDVMDIIRKLNKKNLGMTLDIVHAYTHGEKNVKRYLKEIKKDIRFVFHCHISGHTKRFTHVPFACCEIKDFWRKEIQEFMKFYSKAIVIEGSQRGKKLFIHMADEEIIQDNIKFVKSVM